MTHRNCLLFNIGRYYKQLKKEGTEVPCQRGNKNASGSPIVPLRDSAVLPDAEYDTFLDVCRFFLPYFVHVLRQVCTCAPLCDCLHPFYMSPYNGSHRDEMTERVLLFFGKRRWSCAQLFRRHRRSLSSLSYRYKRSSECVRWCIP